MELKSRQKNGSNIIRNITKPETSNSICFGGRTYERYVRRSFQRCKYNALCRGESEREVERGSAHEGRRSLSNGTEPWGSTFFNRCMTDVYINVTCVDDELERRRDGNMKYRKWITRWFSSRCRMH